MHFVLCLYGISPKQFHPWFKLITDNHDHATRSNTANIETGSNKTTLGNNLFVPYARTTYYGIRSIRVEGPVHWNKIPHNICSVQSHIIFSNIYVETLSFALLN